MRPPLPAEWRARVVTAFFAFGGIGRCETGPNVGVVPEYMQRATGNEPGVYYCMCTVCRVFERALRHASPLLMTGSCEQQRQRAKTLGALRTRAQFDAARQHDPLSVAGWIFLVIGPDEHGNPHAHHTGGVGIIGDDGAIAVTGPRGGFLSCDGNAADPSKPASRNGDGIYAGRERGHPDDTTTYEFIDPSAYPL